MSAAKGEATGAAIAKRDERGDGSGGDHDGRDQEHDEDCGDERGEGRYDGRCDGSGQERDGRGGDRDVATGTWLGDDGRLPRRCATLTPPGCQELWAHAWRAPDCAPARTGAPRTHASIVPSLPCARLMTGQRIFNLCTESDRKYSLEFLEFFFVPRAPSSWPFCTKSYVLVAFGTSILSNFACFASRRSTPANPGGATRVCIFQAIGIYSAQTLSRISRFGNFY